MRRFLKPFSAQTPGEKLAMLDGTNLFFGALLGANLGTASELPIKDYAFLVVILAGTVIALRQFSLSERRRHAWGLLGLYVALITFTLYGGGETLSSLPDRMRDQLAVTLAVWVGSVLLAELFPTRPTPGQADSGAT